MEIGKNERLSFQTTRARKTAPPVAFGEFQTSLGTAGQAPFSGLIKVRIGINPSYHLTHIHVYLCKLTEPISGLENSSPFQVEVNRNPPLKRKFAQNDQPQIKFESRGISTPTNVFDVTNNAIQTKRLKRTNQNATTNQPMRLLNRMEVKVKISSTETCQKQKCLICNIILDSKYSLRSHMKNNHVSSFTEELEAKASREEMKICPICQTEFIHPSKLQIHLRKYKFEDLIEASSFSNTSSRANRSQAKATGPVIIDEDDEIEDLKKKEDEKILQRLKPIKHEEINCQFCFNSFRSKVSLNRHLGTDSIFQRFTDDEQWTVHPYRPRISVILYVVYLLARTSNLYLCH